MSEIRGLWQEVCKEAGPLDVRYKTSANLITARDSVGKPQFTSAES